MDEAGFFSPEEKKDLADFAYEIYTHQGPQITVLTIPDLQGYEIEDFSIRVAEKWQLGQKDKGNGLLIILSKAERKIRIEVGQGIEGEITDFEANKYIQGIIKPSFRQGRFHTGIKLVMEEVAQKFNIPMGEKTHPKIKRRATLMRMSPIMILALPIVFILLMIGQVVFKRNTFARGALGALSVGGAGFLGLGLAHIGFILFLVLIGFILGVVGFHNVLYALASSGRGYHGGGGSFGGGGSSWGGGGGGFSGGGSSGSW
jgi:uncharacterized protein